MHHYCTLFDSNYLDRGLAMHASLMKHAPNAHLYIFPFDDVALETLRHLQLKNVTLIPLADFENQDLLRVKRDRTRGEYCWTCTPYTIDYVLSRFDVPACTYLDADLYFFADPALLLDEMGKASVLITEHRYSQEYNQSITSGIYCVQFLCIRNNDEGRTVLSWWRDRCLEWCYNRMEDGKFGDQKYLDDWTSRFKGVHVLDHLGGGVAPWNIQQYELNQSADGNWGLTVKGSRQSVPLIFYHFHYVKFLPGGRVDISPYRLDEKNVYSLYAFYLRRLGGVHQAKQAAPAISPPDKSFQARVYAWRRKWNGTYNVFGLKEFMEQWPG